MFLSQKKHSENQVWNLLQLRCLNRLDSKWICVAKFKFLNEKSYFLSLEGINKGDSIFDWAQKYVSSVKWEF